MLRGLIVRRGSLDCGRSCVRSMVASKQTIEIGIGCVSDKHVALARGGSKDCLDWSHDHVSEW